MNALWWTLPELGHSLFPLFWLLWSDHTLLTRWEWWAIIPSCPAVTIVSYHAMEVSCYHSFWAVELQLCLSIVTLGSVTIGCVQMPLGIQIKCAGCQNFCIDFCVSIAKLHKDPSRLSSDCPKSTIYLILKTALRDAEAVIKVSSYILLWFNLLGQYACLENLPFPSLTLVGDHAPRKDDGTDFGCIPIQSNGLIALEIKCCCIRLVKSCNTMLIFGSW